MAGYYDDPPVITVIDSPGNRDALARRHRIADLNEDDFEPVDSVRRVPGSIRKAVPPTSGRGGLVGTPEYFMDSGPVGMGGLRGTGDAIYVNERPVRRANENTGLLTDRAVTERRSARSAELGYDLDEYDANLKTLAAGRRRYIDAGAPGRGVGDAFDHPVSYDPTMQVGGVVNNEGAKVRTKDGRWIDDIQIVENPELKAEREMALADARQKYLHPTGKESVSTTRNSGFSDGRSKIDYEEAQRAHRAVSNEALKAWGAVAKAQEALEMAKTDDSRNAINSRIGVNRTRAESLDKRRDELANGLNKMNGVESPPLPPPPKTDSNYVVREFEGKDIKFTHEEWGRFDSSTPAQRWGLIQEAKKRG